MMEKEKTYYGISHSITGKKGRPANGPTPVVDRDYPETFNSKKEARDFAEKKVPTGKVAWQNKNFMREKNGKYSNIGFTRENPKDPHAIREEENLNPNHSFIIKPLKEHELKHWAGKDGKVNK